MAKTIVSRGNELEGSRGSVQKGVRSLKDDFRALRRDMETVNKMLDRLIKLYDEPLKKKKKATRSEVEEDKALKKKTPTSEIKDEDGRVQGINSVNREEKGEEREKEVTEKRVLIGKPDDERSELPTYGSNLDLGKAVPQPPLSICSLTKPSCFALEIAPAWTKIMVVGEPSPLQRPLPSPPLNPQLSPSPSLHYPPSLSIDPPSKGTKALYASEPSSVILKPVSHILFWPKPGLKLMRPLNFAANSVMVTMNNSDGVTDDLRKLPPPVPPPPLPSLPPPLLPPPFNFHYFPSIPCSIGEARAGLFHCSSYFSSIVLGYEQSRSNSVETWVVVQGTPILGASTYRRSRHKEDFPDDFSHSTPNHHGMVLQQNLSITLGDYSCSRNIGLSGGEPEMRDDLRISAEGPNVDENLGYAKACTRLHWDRGFGPYSHEPLFNVTPKVVQLHQIHSGQGLVVSSIVQLLKWQVRKKQHDKFESLDPWGGLQAAISVNTSSSRTLMRTG